MGGNRRSVDTEAFFTFGYSNAQEQPWSEFGVHKTEGNGHFTFFHKNGIFLPLSVLHYACGIITFKSSTSSKFSTMSASLLPSLRKKMVLDLETFVCLFGELLL